MNTAPTPPVWLVAGLRTPFARVDGPLQKYDAISLSVPVAKAMMGQLRGADPDFAVWGTVIPNLTWSNIAREVLMDAGLSPTITAFTTIMACSTSMIGAIEAAGMLNDQNRSLALVGGVESMSRVQIGLGTRLSDKLRRAFQARSLSQRLKELARVKPRDLSLYVPRAVNRTSRMSMGEHTEITVKEWAIDRAAQDELAFQGHLNAVAAWDRGFFSDLVVPLDGVPRDTIPRRDTSLEKLAKLPPAFDRKSGKGSLTAGNSSPLSDGAAAVWVATSNGLSRLPDALPRARLVDWEIAAVNFFEEGLLMAPAFAIPRLLARHGLKYEDIALWEIHEAFSGQVLFHIKALESDAFLRDKARVQGTFGKFPVERLNPNGGSVALGHPFGATGARILSQAMKELREMPSGSLAIVSICADGGQGSVALLQAP
jgi:acetyl-CoA C-acetyltransferase